MTKIEPLATRDEEETEAPPEEKTWVWRGEEGKEAPSSGAAAPPVPTPSPPPQPITMPPVSPAPEPAPVEPQPAQKGRGPWLVLGGVAVLGLVVAAAFLFGGGNDPVPDNAPPVVAAPPPPASETKPEPSPEPQSATLHVVSDPPGAEVSIQGRATGAVTPTEIPGQLIGPPVAVT